MKTKNLITLAGGILLSSIGCFAQQSATKPVQLSKISEGIYEILDGRGARGGAFIGDNGVLVIDAKQDEPSVKQELEAIAKITDKPVKYLVNTHSDGDHVNGNLYFPASVIIISHENCRNEFFVPKRDGSPSDWSQPDHMPFVPSITFSQKMDIYLGSKKAELWYFGKGHTTGDAVVYIPGNKIAFIGDQVFIGRPQLIHAYKGGNSFEHVRTLAKMLQILDAEKFCSGHSEIATRADIQKHIDEMKSLQEKIRSFVAANKSPEDIKNAFDKSQATLVETIYNEIKSGKD